MPERMQEKMSTEHVQDRMPECTPSRVPEYILERMPENRPTGVSEKNPDRMSEYTPDIYYANILAK